MKTTRSAEIAAPFVSTGRAIPRRQFLRGVGVAFALPFLEAMTPCFVRAARKADGQTPRRMLAVCNNLGFVPDRFFPKEAGRGYQLSPYLELLREHREDFTVFSGVSHPDVDGSHSSESCFLTAAPHPASGGFRNTISLDQYMADHIGHLTRFPSLTFGVNTKDGQRSLSWTGGGVLIPCQEKASEIYKQLFLQGTEEEIARQVRKLQLGESIMDAVAEDAGALKRKLGARDRDRLDQYMTGVRDLERRLVMSREWERRPKPKAPAPPPLDPADPSAYMEKVRLMYDMARLAFETDSTRLITIFLDSANSPTIDVKGAEISEAYHNLSHHGKSETKLRQLEAIDHGHMKMLAELLGNLGTRREDGDRLLDRTMVLYGSNMGDANTHATTNMPVLLSGGGFRHGQHLGFDRERNHPLPNLFVSMLQRMGIEADRFASSTGTIRGLEMA